MILGDRFCRSIVRFSHWERGTDIDTESKDANDPFHFSLKRSECIEHFDCFCEALNHTSNQDLFHTGCAAFPNRTDMAQEDLEEREEVEVEGGAKCPCRNGHGWEGGVGTIGALSREWRWWYDDDGDDDDDDDDDDDAMNVNINMNMTTAHMNMTKARMKTLNTNTNMNIRM